MTQALNLCFLAGRSSQAATLLATGAIGLRFLAGVLPVLVVSLAGLALGFRLQARITPDRLRAGLHAVLWVMAASLAAQALLA